MLRVASWILFGLLALVWTGCAIVAAELAQWASQALATGSASEVGRQLATAPVPQWLALWVDPEWIRALQSALLWVVDSTQGALPVAGTLAGWLVPLVWVGWAIGMTLLLVIAVGAHLLARRLLPRLERR